MRYCSQCGRPVRDGEVCICQKGRQMQVHLSHPELSENMRKQTEYHDIRMDGGIEKTSGYSSKGMNQSVSYQSGTDYNTNLQRRVMYGNNIYSDTVSQDAETETFLRQLISLPIKPVEKIRDMVLLGDSSIGVKLLFINLVFILLSVIVFSIALKNSLGALGDYIPLDSNIIKVAIIMEIAVTLHCLLKTALMLVFSKNVFCEQITFAELYIIVESKAVLDGLFLLLYAVLCQVSDKFAFIVYLLGQIYSFLAMIIAYADIVEMEGTKKVYALVLSFVSMILIYYVLISMLFSGVKEEVNNILNPFEQGRGYDLEDYMDDYDDMDY